MKILVSESLSKQGVEILEKAGFTVHIKTKLSKEELIREIGQYDGVIVRSATKVTADLIAAAERLKVIGRAGSGLDNVDTQAATRRGIVVMNTPGGNTVTTAEHTMAMICAMTRQIPQATASMKARKWEKDRFMGVELYNKTLGIVGIGQIGGYLAKLAQGMSMNVIAYDPYLAEERATKMGVEMVELAELFRRADIISLHTPLTAETRSLINAAAIQQMKPGVMIVNCARGGIVNEADLFQALKSKRVAAAAFDVFEDEPVSPDHPLLTLENFICSPHIGAATGEAQENVAIGIAEQIVDYFTKGRCADVGSPDDRGAQRPVDPHPRECRELCECPGDCQGAGDRGQRGEEQRCRGFCERDQGPGGRREKASPPGRDPPQSQGPPHHRD